MWDDMIDVFCTKYFHREETVTFATLQGTKQKNGEDLMEYINRFRDIALDCYDHYEEKTLVEICMGNMIMEYIAILKNLKISQFTQLLQKARKTTQSIRPSSNKPNEQRSILSAMAVSTDEKKKEFNWKGVQESPTTTMYTKGATHAPGQMDRRWGFQI